MTSYHPSGHITRRHFTPRKLLTVLAAAALSVLSVLAPASAFAEPGDGLDQTLDPNQAQGSGQVVLDRGHIDFGPTLNTGEWIIQIHDDTASPSYWRNLEDVVLKVNDAAMLQVPEAPAYAFLGQAPGSEVWVVPQAQKPDVVWAGWNTQEPNVLGSLKLGTTLSVQGVQGPGDVVVYLQSGNFGDPEPLWSSLEAFPQQSWIEVNTHTHANWVFSAPGIYLVDIQFDAELNTGEAVSAQGTLRFAVGDATDPAPAFTMTSQPHDTSAQDRDTAKAQDGPIAAPEAGGNTLAIVVWGVVGVIALALIAAVIIAMAASRRAKARAFAARAQQADLPNREEKAETA